MTPAINLNADMAEGFGAYDIGNDTGILEIVGSANIACGFHAGDPRTMHRVVKEATQRGVSIGAHPGFNDLWGFGRRRIDMRADDLEYMVAYQIGALQAVATLAGHRVTHVKAHGALSNVACADAMTARAIATAIRAVDRALIFVVLPNTELAKAGEAAGLRLAHEVFADRAYADDASLLPRAMPGAVLHDKEEIAARVVRMVTQRAITSVGGKVVKVPIDTVCIHGDTAGAVEIARAVRDALAAHDIAIAPFSEAA